MHSRTEKYAKYKFQTGAAANNKRHRANCEVCGASLAAGSYQSHLERQQDIFLSMVLQQEIMVDFPPVIYHAIQSITTGKYICQVP
jgi:hypothetical protein